MDEQTKQAWIAEIELCTSVDRLTRIDEELRVGTHWSWGYDGDLDTWSALHNALVFRRKALLTAGVPGYYGHVR